MKRFVLPLIAGLLMLSIPGPIAAEPAPQFPVGIFEDANIQESDINACAALFDDLLAHHFDTLQWTNASATHDQACLDAADQTDIKIYFNPSFQLYPQWWNAEVTPDLDAAKNVARPIVDALSKHPSVVGYYIADELAQSSTIKFDLMVQAFHALDPTRPVLASHNVTASWWEDMEVSAKPDLWQAFAYTITPSSPDCSWADELDSRLARFTRSKPSDTDFWMILQTHGAQAFDLRAPTPEELRLQQWISIGRGAHGIIWFIYSTQQGWIGLHDNATLYPEASHLAERLRALAPTLQTTHPATNIFTLHGSGYVYTLQDAPGVRYAVVASSQCDGKQSVNLTSSYQGTLKNLETGEEVRQGQAFTLAPGDGAVFKLEAPTTPARKVCNFWSWLFRLC